MLIEQLYPYSHHIPHIFHIDDDGEEPEKEMGDANAEDIVDEKQWDDNDQDSDAEDGNDQQEQEKFEKDSKMQGEAIEGEMRTKEDDEGGDDKVSAAI